jgi:hypothetical protein
MIFGSDLLPMINRVSGVRKGAVDQGVVVVRGRGKRP